MTPLEKLKAYVGLSRVDDDWGALCIGDGLDEVRLTVGDLRTIAAEMAALCNFRDHIVALCATQDGCAPGEGATDDELVEWIRGALALANEAIEVVHILGGEDYAGDDDAVGLAWAAADELVGVGDWPRSWLRATADISAERRRQVAGEKWSHEHDDQYQGAELARAAVSYIAAGAGLQVGRPGLLPNGEYGTVDLWPWDSKWDKRPKPGASYAERRRALVKGCALGAAEIDRMDREEKRRQLAERVERDHIATTITTRNACPPEQREEGCEACNFTCGAGEEV